MDMLSLVARAMLYMGYGCASRVASGLGLVPGRLGDNDTRYATITMHKVTMSTRTVHGLFVHILYDKDTVSRVSITQHTSQDLASSK